MSIYGSNLDGATAVDFGGGAATIINESASEIDVVSPAGAVGPAVDVTVVTPGGISAMSAQDQFSYYRAVPIVSGLSQSVGPAAGGTAITITGTDLDGATEVDFGGVTGTIVSGSDTPTQITATVPAGTLGTVDVTVTTPGGTSSDSPADQFTGIAAPAVTGIDPSAGPTAGGTDVIIYGTDLGGATGVKFGQTGGTIVDDAGSYMLAESPAGSAGAVDVTVTTPYGTSAPSPPADQFTYVAPPSTTTASYTVTENSYLSIPSPGVLASDTDPQGLPLTATLLTSPADGTLAFGSDGSFSYTPYSGYAGPDSFTYEATNGYASSAPTTVSITVIPPTLSWTEGVTGNWTDGAWGSGSSYPDNTVNATVGGSGSVVNVISDQAANALAIQSGGKVAVGPGAVLSVTTSTSVTGGGTLNVDANGLFSTGGTLILDSGGSLTGGRISAAAYQLNDGMVRANLTGPGGVTEDASSNPPGTVLLSGSNSYPGPTVVNAGTLVVTGMNALPDGTSLTVGAGATFLFDPSQVVSISPVAAIVVSAPGGAAASDASTPVEKAERSVRYTGCCADSRGLRIRFPDPCIFRICRSGCARGRNVSSRGKFCDRCGFHVASNRACSDYLVGRYTPVHPPVGMVGDNRKPLGFLGPGQDGGLDRRSVGQGSCPLRTIINLGCNRSRLRLAPT